MRCNFQCFLNRKGIRFFTIIHLSPELIWKNKLSMKSDANDEFYETSFEADDLKPLYVLSNNGFGLPHDIF